MKTLLLRLDPNLDRQFSEVCGREGYQKSGLIRKLIRDFVAAHQGPIDPIEAANTFGIDTERLRDNFQKSPTERLQNLKQAVAFAEKLRAAAPDSIK